MTQACRVPAVTEVIETYRQRFLFFKEFSGIFFGGRESVGIMVVEALGKVHGFWPSRSALFLHAMNSRTPTTGSEQEVAETPLAFCGAPTFHRTLGFREDSPIVSVPPYRTERINDFLSHIRTAVFPLSLTAGLAKT